MKLVLLLCSVVLGSACTKRAPVWMPGIGFVDSQRHYIVCVAGGGDIFCGQPETRKEAQRDALVDVKAAPRRGRVWIEDVFTNRYVWRSWEDN
jgi:hypothetical protein